MSHHRLYRVALLIFVIVPFIAMFYAMWLLWQRLVGWNDIAILVGMYFFTAIGITIGYHRMLTHRSFEANPVVRFIFLALGSMATEGPAMEWASIHIKHHAHPDEDDDPHSPLHGFFHAHMGWFIRGQPAEAETYGKWLAQDRMVVFISRTFPFWVLLGFVIPYLLGGWTGVLWGSLVRIFLTHHVTWSVNSVCHTFGQRMFETKDCSRNQWTVGLLAFGEGWHNNHHAFPRSAFHGMRWWQFDMSAYVIRLLEKVGLVWNVQRVPEANFEARLIKLDPKKT